jgi:hypothetical protein
MNGHSGTGSGTENKASLWAYISSFISCVGTELARVGGVGHSGLVDTGYVFLL